MGPFGGPFGGPFAGGCSSLGTAPTGPGPESCFGSGAASAFAPMRAFGAGTAPGAGMRGRPGLSGLSLSFGANTTNAPSAHIDTGLPLERQG